MVFELLLDLLVALVLHLFELINSLLDFLLLVPESVDSQLCIQLLLRLHQDILDALVEFFLFDEDSQLFLEKFDVKLQILDLVVFDARLQLVLDEVEVADIDGFFFEAELEFFELVVRDHLLDF